MFEDPPRPKADRPLADMSVEELEQRITDLKSDIEACEAELARKRAHLSAADKLFGAGD